MKTIEFETNFDNKGNIVIPQDIRAKIKRDSSVTVIITNKNSEKKEIVDDVIKFWENYDINGMWNGD